VWTVLYLTIAVSGWLVWREAGFAGAVLPLTIYALELVLNYVATPSPDVGELQRNSRAFAPFPPWCSTNFLGCISVDHYR
jgi:hypothetical protein